MMKGRLGWLAGAALALAAVSAVPGWAKVPENRGAGRGAQKALDFDSARRIDVNNLNMWVTNFGTIAWDVTTGNAGMVYPKGTDKTAIFASGLWMGAKVGTEVRTVVAEYSQEYGPGAMVGTSFDDPLKPEYVVYKVVRYTGDPADTSHVTRDPDSYLLADDLVHHSWSEYMAGAAAHGAPWKIYRLPNPASPGDSVDVPGPDVLGDQMLWCVYNDADASLHTNDAGGSSPLGVEIQQTTFAFNRQGALGNTLFLKYKIINKGGNTLNNMFVSLWSDPDLGGFTDDLVGVDTSLSLGFVYNSTNRDQIYGAQPPAVGYDFFRGPIDRVTGDTLRLASFNKYINGTDPAATSETYNYMQGLKPDGTILINPVTGQPTKFYVSGDPVLGTGWLDTSPADRRFLLTTGPFTMSPGDTQEVVGGIVIGQGKNRLSSVSSLRFFDSFAQAAFDSAFNLPSPPPRPKVQVAVDHGQVTLCWDEASRLNYRQPGYTFEGYNVYQGASVSGPWTLVATYDEVDNVRVIYDEVFDFETGQTVPLFPVAFGSDLGVKFCHTQTEDAVNGGALRDGTQYYFAVTAYSYNPDGKPKVLENAQEAIPVIPQRSPSGTDLTTARVDCPTYSQKVPSTPLATDRVTVEVVNPDSVTGDTYRVFFAPLPNPVTVGSTVVTTGWNIEDITQGDTLITNHFNKSGDDDYPIVDGIRVRVIGPYDPVSGLAEADFLCYPQDWLQGYAGFGGVAFGGGVDYSINLLNGYDPSTDPDSFSTVEIRFSHTNTQKAYRYLRREVGATAGSPPGGRAYLYGGFRDVPFTVWDTDRNIQLDAAFVERVFTDGNGTILPPSGQPASFDSTWLPTDADNGGREYLMIVRSNYSSTENPTYAVNGAILSDLPGMYVLWARRSSPFVPIPEGSVFRFLNNAFPAGTNDLYTINTHGLVHENTQRIASRLDQIRVVPNPYYNRSTYELSPFARVIRFINLPERCTIRIFNLGGDLVRTLEKTDPSTSVVDWDVLTENQLPVASGVYLFHVDAPGAGSTFGRMVVFMEKERLNNF